MRTKQSIGYKMISHGSWSSPIERQRKKRSIRQMWYKKKKEKRTFSMTTVEIVLITSSQLIRLENYMPLKQHRCFWQCTNPSRCKRKWIGMLISHIYGGFPSCSKYKQGYDKRWQSTQWGGGGDPVQKVPNEPNNNNDSHENTFTSHCWLRFIYWSLGTYIKKEGWKMLAALRFWALMRELLFREQLFTCNRAGTILSSVL